MSPEAVQCAQVGKMLGRVVRDHFAPTYEAFIGLVVHPPHALLNLVVHVAYTRLPVRRDSSGPLLAELQQNPRSRRMEYLLRDSWAT